MVTVGKDFCRRHRGDSWTIIGFCRRIAKTISVYHFWQMPLQEQGGGATNGMIGVSLESQSEDVLRTFVCSTETSRMP